MRIIVLGATGKTGLQVIKQALSVGYTVTAYVRNPAKLEIVDENLSVVTGSLSDVQTLSKAFLGQDALLITIGATKMSKTTLMTDMMKTILKAANSTGLKRIVLLSAAGVGDTIKQASGPMRLGIGILMKNVFEDKQHSEDVLRNSGTDWTIVYPPRLTDGPATNHVKVLRNDEKLGIKNSASRADVAQIMLKVLTNDISIKKEILITSN